MGNLIHIARKSRTASVSVVMYWRGLLLLIASALLLSRGAAPEPGADIFATNAPVLRLQIEITSENFRSLQRDARKPVPAIVREGATAYSDVFIHVKGAAGSSRPINDKPALTLNFAHKNPSQRFHGLRKIHLNNSVQDPSYSTENIVGQMFRDAGVPTPRATNARLKLNNRDLGFYVLKEGWTKEFLAMNFKSAKGNLYDGGFCAEITDHLEKDSGDDRKDQPDLDKLAMVSRIEDRAKRWTELQKVLDTDRFLTYMAIETLTWDWDGYMMKHNNYRVYHDPTTDKMLILPHGLDQMFEQPFGSIFHPDFGGLVAGAVMGTSEGSRLYRERVKQMFTNVYRLEIITNRFEFLVKRNREAVAELGNGALRDYNNSVAVVRHRIHERWRGVKDQIENEPAPIRFDKGPIAIKPWHPQNEMGNARLTRTEVEGKPVVQISNSGQSSASWRSKIMLEDGRYRFTAVARSAGLVPFRDDKGEGAGIRISGANARRNKITGNSGWTQLTFDFEVPGGNEVTLVCESRASRGDVWFDLDSLKLEKLR
jgi:spore coat protein H